MARRRSSNSGGGGLLAIIIIIVVIAYAGMALLAIAAVVGIIYLLYQVISSIVKSAAIKRENETARESVETRQIPVSISTIHVDKSVEKVRSIIREYQVEKVPCPSFYADPLQKELESYQCVEVLQAVNRILNQKEFIVKELNSIKQSIDDILLCPGCTDDEDKVVYLEKNRSQLANKLDEYEKKRTEIKSKKIILMNKHSFAFSNLKDAFAKVIQSEKVLGSTGVDIHSFVKMNASLPDDLFSSTPFAGHMYLADNMRKVLKGEESPLILPEETINVSAIIELFYKSEELHREVFFEEL